MLSFFEPGHVVFRNEDTNCWLVVVLTLVALYVERDGNWLISHPGYPTSWAFGGRD